MKILGIETSCDETAIAVVEDGKSVLSSIIYSQTDEHSPYGGVVPEIASRSHIQKLLPIFDQTLDQAGVSLQEIDAIAVATKPGLMGALMTGVTFAKTLCFALKKPLIDVHHIYGHLVAASLGDQSLDFPMIALIASGGHTTVLEVQSLQDATIIGRSIDDAAGEALDKAAKLLGLGFPGGPEIEKFALGGNPTHISFPMALKGQVDFSFSGLKTSLRTWLQKNPDITQIEKKDVCASFQEAVMQTLCTKLALAMKQTGIRNIMICGGVAANKRLRQMTEEMNGVENVFLTPPAYCTDNAAMIAAAGFYTFKKNGPSSLEVIPTSHAPFI